MSVTLSNVNLRSPSEYQFALTPGLDIGYMHYTTTSGLRFLGTGEDSAAVPSQRTYFTEPSAYESAERRADGCMATLRNKKQI